TATFTSSPTPGSDLIFADGFESGNLSAWTSSTTDSGDLSVSMTAAMKGTYGMQAVLDDTNTIYVTDDNPNAEPRYRARFYFDPNSITMASGDAHFIFKGFSGASTDVFQVEFRYSSGNYEIRARVLNDASAWTNSNWFIISDASHYIEVDWRAATSSGANDGYLTLWIDGTQQANLTGMDNDTWRVDRARLGALSGMDAGTNGTYYFDAFESRRSTYIGPVALGPLPVLADTLPRNGGGQGGGQFVSYQFAPALQSGSLTFIPAADAYIESAVPAANHGADTEVQVDNSPAKHFLLKFGVTGINSQTVTDAKLCLYNTDSANAGGKFYSVTDDTWQEETVTWSNAPTAGTTILAELGAVSPSTWYEVNLTSHITGDGTYSLRISDSSGGADYSSKEGTNDPKLLVATGGATPQSCSSSATATATNTPTPGPSPTPTRTPTPSATPIATNTPTATAPVAFSSAAFVYDGDGKRVKSIFNGTATTYFVGTHYEVANGVVTKYYYAGAQRIAMRTNGTLNYLLGDHLGSTSLTTSATGTVISELRYKAWGETRYSSGTTTTKYTYTGQYSNVSDFGLMFYNARWYDPALGRFAQPDPIVPISTQGVQAYDRYSYVNNNPVRYNDPTGHCIFGLDTAVCVVAALVIGAVVLTGDAPHLKAGDAGNIIDLLVAGVQHDKHANIVNEGLQSLQDDPDVKDAQKQIVNAIKNDPRYKEQSFFIRSSDPIPFTAEGPSGNWKQAFWEVNQAFFMVRNAKISATNVKVSADGTIDLTWHTDDKFDFIPGPKRSKDYNKFASIWYPIYHGLLRAESFQTEANWNQIIPPSNSSNSCGRCR
nr:DNRLRE domain-containing protein [Chloroflexota bacterium]